MVQNIETFQQDPMHAKRYGVDAYTKLHGAVSLKNIHLIDCKPGKNKLQ